MPFDDVQVDEIVEIAVMILDEAVEIVFFGLQRFADRVFQIGAIELRVR